MCRHQDFHKVLVLNLIFFILIEILKYGGSLLFSTLIIDDIKETKKVRNPQILVFGLILVLVKNSKDPSRRKIHILSKDLTGDFDSELVFDHLCQIDHKPLSFHSVIIIINSHIYLM